MGVEICWVVPRLSSTVIQKHRGRKPAAPPLAEYASFHHNNHLFFLSVVRKFYQDVPELALWKLLCRVHISYSAPPKFVEARDEGEELQGTVNTCPRCEFACRQRTKHAKTHTHTHGQVGRRRKGQRAACRCERRRLVNERRKHRKKQGDRSKNNKKK